MIISEANTEVGDQKKMDDRQKCLTGFKFKDRLEYPLAWTVSLDNNFVHCLHIEAFQWLGLFYVIYYSCLQGLIAKYKP